MPLLILAKRRETLAPWWSRPFSSGALPRCRGARPGPPGRLSKRPSRFTRRLMGPGLRRLPPRRQPYVGRPCALAWPGLRPRDEARRGRGLWRLARHARAAGEGAFALRVLGALPKPVEGLASLRWLHENGAREQEAWRLAALSVTPGGEVARYDYGRGRCRRAPKVATVRARLALPPGRQLGRVRGRLTPPWRLSGLALGEPLSRLRSI